MTTTHGYYQQPTICKDTVIFVCEDDLWAVSAKGGIARRLTANLGAVSQPALSPDGEWLAFTGRDEGEIEIYVMPALGGSAQRLTYFGAFSTVVGWTPDSQKILFTSDMRAFDNRLATLYAIPREGGELTSYSYGPLHTVSYSKKGGVVIGRQVNDLARWKRYRGGRAGTIWIDSAGKGTFKPLFKKLDSNLACPMWIGKRIYFLSDHEGVGNLYSCKPSGKDIQRHTHHEKFYVRFPKTDGSRIVYQAGADLYIFNPADDSSHKIEIQFHSPRTQRNRKFVAATRYLEHYALHPEGHSFALVSRGKPFAMSNWEGAVIQYGQPQGTRYRLIEWLNDGKRLVMVSDETGEERLEVYFTDENKRLGMLDKVDVGRPLFIEVSPTSNDIVLANHRHELIFVDQNGVPKTLDQSQYGRITRADWSPNGEWVVYHFPTSWYTAAIKLCHVETGETYFVTRPNDMYDYGPTFDAEGKYIYFLSTRVFNPVVDEPYYNWGFPEGTRPYLVTLRQDIPDPFIPLPNGVKPSNGNHKAKNDTGQSKSPTNGDQENEANHNDQEKSEQKKEPALVIDLTGIDQRVIAFPVPESRYGQIRSILKGKILYTRYPVEGALTPNRTKNKNGRGVLLTYDLNEQKEEYLVGGITSFEVSRKKEHLLYRNGKDLRVLKAGDKPDNAASGFNKKSGWLVPNRAKVAINPPQEWLQMLREAWRLQRDHFWTEDMSQVDWQTVYERYQGLLDRITTRREFSDLVWEMQGELGTSHAYEYGGDYRAIPRYRQGLLGAEFEYDAESGGYRITHIVQGDSWVEGHDSPLNRLGMNLKVGDIIMRVNGQPLSETFSPQQALTHQADIEVQLDIFVPLAEVLAEDETSTSENAVEEADKIESAKDVTSATDTDVSTDSETKTDVEAEKTVTDNQTEEDVENPPTEDPDANNESVEPPHTRKVFVKTLKDETKARYREWVETNRRYVHETTQGQVGYLHIPDMGANGFAEFHRYYRAEAEKIGLIVDVRFNRGGNVSQLLLTKLAQRRLGYDQPRYGTPTPYPDYSVLGPMVALTNEFTASDGDIFSHVFKMLKLGKLVGKRTWGGVIGIWTRHRLVDGTITSQPEFSNWFEDVGWGIENYGTTPHIEVDYKPQDYSRGVDPQLERGIKEIMKQLAKNPPQIPDFGPRPNRALPTLPPLKKKKK